MDSRLLIDIGRQPDDTTCGPTCLHAVYNYFGDVVSLDKVVAETPQLDEGGTLAVLLGSHALSRGYEATIYTYNLHLFDPTWFGPVAPPLADRIEAQMHAKEDAKIRLASKAYLRFLEQGGRMRMEDLTAHLLRRYLKRGIPILCGLSATYLYDEPRERINGEADDIAGVPQGHFVVLCGYDSRERTVLVADPLHPNPLAKQNEKYIVDLDRLICAIMLGIVTYDANLLVIQPGSPPDLPIPEAPSF